jgi:hypothetical protein
VPNVIIANEIVGRANVAQLAGLKRAHPRTAICSLVDSVEVVEQLVRHGGSALAPGGPLPGAARASARACPGEGSPAQRDLAVPAWRELEASRLETSP